MHLERDHFIDYLLKLLVYQSVQNPVYLGNMLIIIGITGLTAPTFGTDLVVFHSFTVNILARCKKTASSPRYEMKLLY